MSEFHLKRTHQIHFRILKVRILFQIVIVLIENQVFIRTLVIGINMLGAVLKRV